jgi:ribosomal protein S13
MLLKFDTYSIENVNFIETVRTYEIIVYDENALADKDIRKYYLDGFESEFSIIFIDSDLELLDNMIFMHKFNIYVNTILNYLTIHTLSNFINFIFYIKPTNVYVSYEKKQYFNSTIYHFFKTRRLSIFRVSKKFVDHRRYFNISFKDSTYSFVDKLTLYSFLKQRYGIGCNISKLLCNYLGVSYKMRVHQLPMSTYYNRLSIFFLKNLNKLDSNLMNFNLSKQTESIKLKTYKGFRLLKGYPANGQRTRSNHRTSMRRPYKFEFFYI